MNRRVVLLSVLAALVVALFLLDQLGQLHPVATTRPSQTTGQPTIIRPRYSPSAARKPGGDAEPARQPRGAARAHKAAGPDAIANEYVLRLKTTEDYLSFLQRARQKGIAVLGSLDKLRAVRIRVRNQDELDDLLSGSPDTMDYENNYWARIPEQTEKQARLPDGVYSPFGDQALSWLGVPADHQSWGKGVTVSIVDSGVQDSPTLAGKSITRLDLLGSDAAATGPYEGHATAIASILAGSSPDAPGIAPSVDILSIRAASADGVGNTFTLAQGIVEAADRGAAIISISMGTQSDTFILQEANQYALEKGAILVASTGNDAVDGVAYPAKYPGVLAVTAVDANGNHLYFANTGPEVVLAAPGLGINAAWSGNQIVSFSGTSASVPFVDGALAMLLAQNPQMTPSQAADTLVRYSDDAGAPSRDNEYGYGVLDMGRVLDRNRGGVYDIAIAAHYFDPASSLLIVSAQNRGTETLPVVQLNVTIDGANYSYQYRSVDVGQTVSQRFAVDVAKVRAGGTVYVSSNAQIIGGMDSRTGNNVRNSVITGMR